MERLLLNQIRMFVIGETIDKPVEQYFKARKIAEALGKRLLCNDELLAPIP